MEGEPPTYLLVGRGELDLPVNAARAQQSRVQDVDAVRGHDHLHRENNGHLAGHPAATGQDTTPTPGRDNTLLP